MTLSVVLLAAGSSRRYGRADKLAAGWKNGRLIDAAAATARELGADRLIAVIRPDGAPPEGFEAVTNPAPERGLGSSLATGIRAAGGVDRVLVLLADMPLVPAAHCRAVIARCTDRQAAASTDGTAVMPPACFPKGWSDRLATACGDSGARSILRALPREALVAAPPGTLVDVDTPGELSALAGAA